jgi:hypothetical protein
MLISIAFSDMLIAPPENPLFDQGRKYNRAMEQGIATGAILPFGFACNNAGLINDSE